MSDETTNPESDNLTVAEMFDLKLGAFQRAAFDWTGFEADKTRARYMRAARELAEFVASYHPLIQIIDLAAIVNDGEVSE